MKKYILKAFVLALAYMLIYAALDAAFSELQSFRHYLIGAFVFAILLTGFNYLVELLEKDLQTFQKERFVNQTSKFQFNTLYFSLLFIK